MLFNKNKNNNTSSSFRPSQLTPENFYKFARKYSSTKKQYDNDISYTTPTR